MKLGGRRGRHQIIYEILDLLSAEEAGVTRIVYVCNLNFRVVTRSFIPELLKKELITQTTNGDKRKRYATTPKGQKVREGLEKALQEMQEI